MARRKDTGPETEAMQVTDPVQSELEAPAVPGPVEEPPAPLTDKDQPLPPRRSAGFLASLLGGALAAIGGFAMAHFDVLGLRSNDSSAEISALAERLEASLSKEAAEQASGLQAVRAEVDGLVERISTLQETPAPDLSRLEDIERRLQVIEAVPAGGDASNAAVAAKLAELERRVAELPAAGVAPDMQAELDAALSRLSEAEAAAKSRADEAAAAADAVRQAQLVDALSDAVLAGRPFTAELQALGDAEVATALAPLAEGGVATLEALQAQFPDAARDALRAAREVSASDGWGDRFVDFLASQTGARSLTPRDGAEPDAVLSRAEFAVSEGRLSDALAELESMDATVKAPLETWMAAAKAKVAADAALAAARGE